MSVRNLSHESALFFVRRAHENTEKCNRDGKFIFSFFSRLDIQSNVQRQQQIYIYNLAVFYVILCISLRLLSCTYNLMYVLCLHNSEKLLTKKKRHKSIRVRIIISYSWMQMPFRPEVVVVYVCLYISNMAHLFSISTRKISTRLSVFFFSCEGNLNF